MKWEKVKYPYSYNKNEKDYMDNVAIPNFEKFIKKYGIDEMSKFNFAYNPKEVLEGGNPEYEYTVIINYSLPDHTNYYFRNSKTRETFLVGFPYGEYSIEEFKNKYRCIETIFQEKDSFYHNKGTKMIVISNEG